MKTFGQRLRAARVETGYRSAASLAAVLGIEEATYRKYERGASEPNFETLVRICGLLKISPNDLLPLAAQAAKKGEPDDQASTNPRAA